MYKSLKCTLVINYLYAFGDGVFLKRLKNDFRCMFTFKFVNHNA